LLFAPLHTSSKVFAMANAAGHLRSNETHCGSALQNHQFGLDGSVTGKHGYTQLGDLATIICSYDHTAGYSSNSLSSYFHDIGWRDRANNLVQNWLLTPGKTTRKSDLPQTLGGNYGEATPSDLTLDVTAHSSTADKTPRQAASAASDAKKRTDTAAECQADKDPWPVTYSNSLSALSAAELVRRIALHRELPQELQFPGAVWEDIQVGSLSSVDYYRCGPGYEDFFCWSQRDSSNLFANRHGSVTQLCIVVL
jgi:hypothetical protein